MTSHRATIRAVTSLTLAALLFGAELTRAASPGGPVPGPTSPCVLDPGSCPPPPPPPEPDPWEPGVFGLYKLKVHGVGKDVANEALEVHAQFPTLFLETEDGFSIPLEIVIDPIQAKMDVAFTPLSTPILEAWVAQRVHQMTGGAAVVTLTRGPKVKSREKKGVGTLMKLKLRGTVELDGEVRGLRYKGTFLSLANPS